jgi:hypothetical protein
VVVQAQAVHPVEMVIKAKKVKKAKEVLLVQTEQMELVVLQEQAVHLV